MASCKGPETPLDVWGSLARLRDISRLVLGAIDRDDLDGVARLAREADALVELLKPALQEVPAGSPLPEDLKEQLTGLSGSYRAILAGLRERRDEVSGRLVELRRTRGRLRSAGLRDRPGPGLLDRNA